MSNTRSNRPHGYLRNEKALGGDAPREGSAQQVRSELGFEDQGGWLAEWTETCCPTSPLFQESPSTNYIMWTPSPLGSILL